MNKNMNPDDEVTERCEPLTTEGLAHNLWVERGCQVGSPELDWFEAERRLNAVKESADA